MRMTIVESASAASLSAVVTEHVARGATVYTDGRIGYRRTDYTSRYTVRRCIVRSMTKRLSLILGETDESVLEPFIRSGTGQHRVLQRWAAEHGVGNVNSEAAAIRALLQAGADALRDEVLDDGYAELAQVYDGTKAGDERRAARDRYVARTEDTA